MNEFSLPLEMILAFIGMFIFAGAFLRFAVFMSEREDKS